MIHRIEPGYLRTNDALSKREDRERRRRRRPHDSESEDTANVPSGASILEEEKESVTFDLVA